MKRISVSRREPQMTSPTYNQNLGVQRIFEEIKAKMFPNLVQTINPQT